MSDESVYQQIILDHYKHPQHRGLPEDFDAQVHHVNPTCGDEVTVRLRLHGDTIADLGWEGEGCSISQASTSVMSDLVVGKSIDEALGLQAKFLGLVEPALGAPAATDLARRLWAIEEVDDVGLLVEAMAKASS